jgi:hypothetical protein
MKFILLVFLSFSLFAFDAPVEIRVEKKNVNTFALKVSVPKGFAIQREAPHKINLKGENGLSVKDFKPEFKGPIIINKPEYFEAVDEMPLQLTGKGELAIDARIFYCDLNKNICYPSKIQKKETVN